MSSDSESDVESEYHDADKHLSLDELKSLRVAELKEWLSQRGLKRSGNKDVLINRVYRAMSNGIDSDEASDTNDCPSKSDESIVPVQTLSKDWKSIESEDIPDISIKDIDAYFLYHKNPTGGTTNFERQMKKAKKFSNEGFVKDIEFNEVNKECKYCYIRCNCMPSMRQNVIIGNFGKTANFYSLHICTVKTSGHILQAECNCKAGAAGLCAHIGALLYTLVKTKSACTSNECRWDRPRPLLRKPSPKRVCDINFYKTDKENPVEKVKPYPGVYQAGPCQDDSEIFLNEILNGLKDLYPQSVIYQTLTAKPADISSFLNLFIPNFMYADHVDLNSKNCIDTFNNFLSNLMVTDEVSLNLEKGTRGQHINQNWREARSCLVTASVMGEVVKRLTTKPDNLVKKIRGYVSIPDTVKSLKYGRKYEPVAVEHYVQNHMEKCKKVQIESRGLFVNPKYPYIGASIDGLVICNDCGTGLLEVKCPYGSLKSENPWRHMIPTECGKDEKFFCTESNEKLFLKEKHNYMYQIQGQLAIYELEWVDFVVWTKRGISVQRITFSPEIWKYMLPKLKAFYLSGIVPELFTSRVKRGISLY